MNPRQLSLIGAVTDGDTEAVRALLAAGSDVNETASGGRTPLILAILFGRTQIMTLLLEAGADPHQRDSLGLNALDWADRKGLQLLNQRQARKQETPPVTPSKEPVPLGGLAPSQSEKQTTRASGATTQSASDDEKSRRWLAGFKRRIDEEASHKIKEVEPTPPPTTEVEATPENESPHILVNDSLVEASAHEPERAVISAPVKRLPNFRTEAWLAGFKRRIDEEASHKIKEVEPTPPPTTKVEATPENEPPHILVNDSLVEASAHEPEQAVISAPVERKSRRWLARFKRRIDEEASHKIKEVEPTPLPTTKVEATPENEPPHIPVNDTLVEASAHEPERAVISGPVERLPNFQTEALVKDQISPAQTTDLIGPPDAVETLEPPSSTIGTPPPRSIHRKRCPKCNTVYESELLAYCAIDVTPLVDANQPLSTAPPKTAGMPVVWLLIMLTFIVAAGVTYFMIPYLRSEPNAPTATSPTQAQSIADAPAVGAGLSGKQLEVPAAEYPASARRKHVFGTVTVRVTVNKEGKVITVKVLNGDWRLRKAAIAAALKATFSTEKLTERKTVGTIAYTFKE